MSSQAFCTTIVARPLMRLPRSSLPPACPQLQQQLQMTLEAHGHTIQQIMQGHAFSETSRRSA